MHSFLLTTPKIEEDDDDARGDERPRQRQRRDEADSNDDDESMNGGGDERDESTETQLVKKLVRYALACEYSRTPIRRDGIREKGKRIWLFSVRPPTPAVTDTTPAHSSLQCWVPIAGHLGKFLKEPRSNSRLCLACKWLNSPSATNPPYQ